MKQTTAKIEAVLIVEDEQFNSLYLKEILSDYCKKIYYAKNGLEAIEIVKEIDDISLVLMDLKMPVMDGYEATRKIKYFKPDLPIIAQTAFAQSQDQEKALEAGCDDYITKPLSGERLLDLIKKVLMLQ